MKKLNIIELTNEEGIKIFFTNSSRVHITDFPKEEIKNAKLKLEDDFKTSGVYILIGTDVEDGESLAYIGEADNLDDRINTHIPKKEWIDRIILIKSQLSHSEFSKTELHFIEKKLINIFSLYSEYTLKNKNSGQGRLPSAVERIFLNSEIGLIVDGLNALGYKISNELKEINISSTTEEMRREIDIYAKIANSQNKVYAKLMPDNSVIVPKGTKVKNSSEHRNDHSMGIVKMWLNRLTQSKKIKNLGDEINYDIEFLEDVRFNKPSSAGWFITNGSNNGWKVWKDKSNNREIDYLRIVS